MKNWKIGDKIFINAVEEVLIIISGNYGLFISKNYSVTRNLNLIKR